MKFLFYKMFLSSKLLRSDLRDDLIRQIGKVFY